MRVSITVNFNTNPAITYNYNTNESSSLGSGQESLFTTVIHELIHGMGFINYVNPESGSFDGFPTAYDALIVQDNINPVAYTALTDAQRLEAITSNNLFWNGPLGVAGNGGCDRLCQPQKPTRDHLASAIWTPPFSTPLACCCCRATPRLCRRRLV